jgi:ketol-acid reductoisomerase
LTVGPRIVDRKVRASMEKALRDIRSGKFAREFIAEMKTGRKRYTDLIRAQKKHPIEVTGKRLRRLMRWNKKT